MAYNKGMTMNDKDSVTNGIKRRLELARVILKYLRPEAPDELRKVLIAEVKSCEARLSGYTLNEHKDVI